MKHWQFALLLVLSVSFAAHAKKIDKVSIATYNVENLFDVEHDEEKNDYQFLPISHPLKEAGCREFNSGNRLKNCMDLDWTAEKLKIKLDTIKYAIHTLPSFPDILTLVEVENQNVLEMLKNHLGYDQAIITNSEDQRGIDVAVLYKNSPHFKLKKILVHEFKDEIFAQNKTRDILEVQFDLQGELVSILVNHWPSQGNSDEMRMGAGAEMMNAIKKSILDDGVSQIIATGDFNTVDDDVLNPIRELVLRPMELNGDKRHTLIDLDQQYLKDGRIPFAFKKKKPLGTYFFATNMQWNMLDRFFVSQSFFDSKSKVTVDLSSYKIHSFEKLITSFTYNDRDLPHFGSTITGIPWRYNHRASEIENAGYSDHFAIYMELNIKQK